MNGGHFEYLLMPFGLITAPAVFQTQVNYFLNIFVFVNLDDALICSKLLAEHQVHVHSVLQCLLKNRLYVKAEKCEFHSSICLFLRIYFDWRAGRRTQLRFELSRSDHHPPLENISSGFSV